MPLSPADRAAWLAASAPPPSAPPPRPPPPQSAPAPQPSFWDQAAQAAALAGNLVANPVATIAGLTAPQPRAATQPGQPGGGLSVADRRAWEDARPVGRVEDAWRSLVTGAEQTGSQMAAAPRNVAANMPNLVDLATDQARGIADLITHAVSPSNSGQGYVPMLERPITSFAPPAGALATDPRVQDSAIGRAAAMTQSPFLAIGGLGPTQAQTDEWMQSHGLPFHQAQYTSGDVANFAGHLAPGAFLPTKGALFASLPTRAARVAIPALTATTAQYLGQGSGADPDALANLGMLLGGGVQGAGEAWFNPETPMNRALATLTPRQISQVEALRENAGAQGIFLSLPEAVDKVTNGASGLSRLQSLVENAPRTAATMRAAYADRPQQIADAVDRYGAQVAAGDMRGPTQLGGDVQSVAGKVVQGAKGLRRRIAGTAYGDAGPATVDPTGVGGLLADVDASIAADKTGLLGDRLADFRDSFVGPDGRPLTDVDSLSRVRNYWQDQIGLPDTHQDALTSEQHGEIADHLKNLGALLSTNANWARGQDLYDAASDAFVNPLANGPIGALAGTSDLGSQIGSLFPRSPFAGQAADTAQAVGALAKADPATARELLAQAVMRSGNEAQRSTVPDQFAGARWARAIAGNPEQRATMGAALGAIDPDNTGLAQNFNDLVDATQATGWRQRSGQALPFNLQSDEAMLRAGPLALRAIQGAGDPLEWTRDLGNWANRMRYGKKLDILANLMTDPDTARVFSGALNPPGLPSIFGVTPAAGQNLQLMALPQPAQ